MPAPRWLRVCAQGARWGGTCLVSFAVWTLWLVLVIVLGLQIYIASVNELEIPPFVLRSLEERLAVSGVRVSFGRTSFDPSGRVLIENVRVSLPSYAEPVATVRALYVRLDPWELAAGNFVPLEARVIGANWSVPAMLSSSGRPEEILRDLDATLVPGKDEVELQQFVARIAGVAVSMRGSIHLPSAAGGARAPLPTADFLARNYPALCRQLIAISDHLATLDAPILHLDLTPSETRGAIAAVTLTARGYKLDGSVPVSATGLRVSTRFPILGDAAVTTRLDVTADRLELPFGAKATHVRAVLHGRLQPARFNFEPESVQLTAGAISAAGFSASPVAAQLTPGPFPKIKADIVAQVMGGPLGLRAEADFAAQTARVHFDGVVSPAILGPLGDHLHAEVRRWFNFGFLNCTDGDATFGPDWKFQRLTARVSLRDIDAYHVHMEEGRATIDFDGRHLYSPDAYARVGENFAQGTYENDLATRDYRFLLVGQLRPLDIGGWFGSGWWQNFFGQFDLPAAPPTASVDVQGRWGDGTQSAVFISVNTIHPIIRGATFDHARSRIYVRPGYNDILELSATSGRGELQGTFTYVTSPFSSGWRSLDFDLNSSLDLAIPIQMAGPAGASMLAPFRFAQPPSVKVSGRLTGPDAPEGAHQSIQLAAKSTGEFRLHDFPLDRAAFDATIQDDTIAVEHIMADVAGGSLTGRAKISGDTDRRIAFDGTLKDAGLAAVSTLLQDYAARQRAGAPSPEGKFVLPKNNVRLDLTAAAEGRYGDPLSFHGAGNATLTGSELGEIRLLGLLSDLLKFTALRFTTAKTSFTVDGRRLLLPDVKLAGANSAIEAQGAYALDKRELDFTAKLYPFHESGNVIKKGFEVVLAPFTNIFEIKLTGTLDKPSWGLVVGPTNLLHSLAPEEAPGKPAPPPAAPAPNPDANPTPPAKPPGA